MFFKNKIVAPANLVLFKETLLNHNDILKKITTTKQTNLNILYKTLFYIGKEIN